MINCKRALLRILSIILLVSFSVIAAAAQTTTFTYQGVLNDNGAPASGSFDLRFNLFDLAQNGAQQGQTIILTNVSVVNGLYTVPLDFGSNPFISNSALFLQIGTRPSGNGAVSRSSTLMLEILARG